MIVEVPMKSSFQAPVTAIVVAMALGWAGTAVAADEAASLRATEEAFARTMAERDHAAFVSFLAEDTVFFVGRDEIRGREAVAAAWKALFDDPTPPFSWRPEVAAVVDSGTLGLTSGPVFAPDGRRIGTFNSVWRRRQNGSWEIVFDRGCPDCECPPQPTDGNAEAG
jgi:ketosteroid isomerase-like protein